MKKILITGGLGFVGRQIVRSLSKRKVEITLVVRSGKENTLEKIACVKKVISSQDIFVENRSWWAEACKGIDTVIHAAWHVKPREYLESEQNIQCLIGSLELARGAASAKVARFIGIGTCLEYEVSEFGVSIRTPLKPSNTYASTKASLFTTCSAYFPSRSVEFVWCRLFNLYGEGENERRLMPYIRKKILNGEVAELTEGKQIRDYMEVSQAGAKIAEIALGRRVGPFNICSGSSTTIRDFAEKIADEYGRRDLLSFTKKDERLEGPPYIYVNPKSGPDRKSL